MVFLLFITGINKKQASLPPPPILERRTCVIGKLNKEILSPEPSPALRPRLWSQFKSRRSPCQDLLGLPGCPCPRCCQPCPGRATPPVNEQAQHTHKHTPKRPGLLSTSQSSREVSKPIQVLCTSPSQMTGKQG